MEFFAVAILALFGGIYWLWKSAKRGAAEGDALDIEKAASLHRIEGFTPEVIFNGQRTSYGLAIDPKSRKFAFSIPGASPRVYHYSQLIAVEVDKDGTTVTTSKGQVSTSGAAVATALAGPVAGLLMGAKSSSTSSSVDTINLALKIYVDDIHTPCFCIPIGGGFKDEFGPDKFLIGAVEIADAWFSRFKAILIGLEGNRPTGVNPDAITYSTPAPAPIALGWAARSFSA